MTRFYGDGQETNGCRSELLLLLFLLLLLLLL